MPTAAATDERRSREAVSTLERLAPRCGVPARSWRHLGRASRLRLRGWEAAAGRSAASGAASRVCDGLLWCLESRESASWWAAFLLGRVARAIRPARIAVLVWGDGTGAAPDVAACGALCRRAVSGPALEVLPLPGAAADEFYSRIAGSLRLNALQRRRASGAPPARDMPLGAAEERG